MISNLMNCLFEVYTDPIHHFPSIMTHPSKINSEKYANPNHNKKTQTFSNACRYFYLPPFVQSWRRVMLMFRRYHHRLLRSAMFSAKSQITVCCCIASSGRVANRRRRCSNNSAFLNLSTRTRAAHIPEDRNLLVHHGPKQRGLLEYLRMLLHLLRRLFRSLNRDADDWPAALSVPFSRAHRRTAALISHFGIGYATQQHGRHITRLDVKI